MTKLDINAYGVQELNRQEMVETEGGFWPLVVAAVVVVAAACAGCKYEDHSTTNYYIKEQNVTNNNAPGSGNSAGDIASKNGKGNK